MTSRARKMERPPAYDVRIADIRKNAQERLRVSLHEFNGYDMLSVRVFVDPRDGGHDLDRMVPTQKGVTISVAMLPKIRRALENAEREALRRGLIGQGAVDEANGDAARADWAAQGQQ